MNATTTKKRIPAQRYDRIVEMLNREINARWSEVNAIQSELKGPLHAEDRDSFNEELPLAVKAACQAKERLAKFARENERIPSGGKYRKVRGSQRLRANVHAAHNVLLNLDYFQIVSDEKGEWLYFAEMPDGSDEHCIGGEARKRIADFVRALRRTEAWEQVKQRHRKRIETLRRTPGDMMRRPRMFRVDVKVPARKATQHRDCQYCGMGPGDRVCGVCKEEGIDGRVIPGTSARKAYEYTKWQRK